MPGSAPYLPGWLHFAGFSFPEFIEIMTMAGHGVFGITTETSLTLVFYFLAFSAMYAVVGGTELFMDLALKLVGRAARWRRQGRGGLERAVRHGERLRRRQCHRHRLLHHPADDPHRLQPRMGGAHEAIASTGGQLMPPVMGIAAFVMADIIGVPYAKIALAATIPALAYFGSLYLLVHLNALRSGIGSLPAAEIDAIAAGAASASLLITPPLALIAAFALGYDAAMAAVIGGIVGLGLQLPARRTAAHAAPLPGNDRRVRAARPRRSRSRSPPSASSSAVAVQSNLAIKFSTEMLAFGGGTLVGSLFFVSLGIIILGMGLPTVAAYVIGAILFVPALQKLGVDQLASHFFVLFFAVLVDGHAAGRARVLHGCRHRARQSQHHRALRLHSQPADRS